jgi:membrane-associated phospholipid phosphatase
LQGALRIAQFAAMFYKDIYQRARPSQLWPELMPPLVIPGHASFPSAHATEAYFISFWLERIAGPVAAAPGLPAGANVVPSAISAPAVPNGIESPTRRLAQRIARNREVLGLHYPSDSEAGRLLAANLFNTITGAPASYPKLINLLNAAVTEWTEFTV